MAGWYVHRNGDGTVASAHSEMQPGYATEWLADAAPDLVAFFAAAYPPDPIAAGLAIVWASAPALNGTYAIHEQAQQNIVAVVTGINAGQGLPGGAATFTYTDTMGDHGPFTADQFVAFARAVRDFVYSLSRGTIPAQPVSIG